MQPASQPHRSLRAAQNGDEAMLEVSSGVLPPARELRELEDFCPGVTERLLQMAEREVANRHELQKAESRRSDALVQAYDRDTRAASNLRARGQWIAAILTLASFAVSVWCASHGYNALSITIATTTLATILGAFILGRPRPSKGLPQES